MPITNFPSGISSFGVPVLGAGGIGVPTTTGNYWFVSSTLGNDGNLGTSASSPFGTIGRALTSGFAAANQGDVIVVMPGHTETITAAAGINLNVAGVTIVGLGTGLNKPTINFTTSTAATFKMGAANTRISNFRFTCGIASQVTMIDVQAKQVQIDNCDFSEGTATGLSFIAVTAAANVADKLKVLNCTFYNPTAGNMNHAVAINTVQDDVEIGFNEIRGQFALSGLHNVTGNVVTQLRVHDNYIRNLTAAKVAMNLISACTGAAWRNTFIPGDATVASALFGSLQLEGGNVGINGNLDAGETFVYAVPGVVSSTITTGGVDISVASTGGKLAVEDVIVSTDATGLATGTNFQITANNTDGTSAFWVNAVSGLGANVTLNTGGVTNLRPVLESGKKLTLKSTAANCTGAGVVDVYVRFRRLTGGANLSAA